MNSASDPTTSSSANVPVGPAAADQKANMQPARSDDESHSIDESSLADQFSLAAEPKNRTFAKLSFVVPAMNERESLAELHHRIVEVCERFDWPMQLIFIDDGSTDGTWDEMVRLSESDSRVIAIRFRRNFGKAAALAAGFAEASGEVVFTMDADLQDDPQEIPRFLEKLDEGFDVVSGWKRIRHDPWHKRYPSKVFNGLVSRMTRVRLHDHNCGFKAYRDDVTRDVVLYGERHRFVPVLAASRGYRVGEIPVQHHARQFGVSKYGVTRLVKGFLDLMTIHLITGYGGRPLHLIGTAGLLCFGLGAVGMVYLSAMWVLSRLSDAIEVVHLHQTAIFYYCILAVLLGSQCLLAGLLAELFVSRTQRSGAMFSIAQRRGPGAGPSDGLSPERSSSNSLASDALSSDASALGGDR